MAGRQPDGLGWSYTLDALNPAPRNPQLAVSPARSAAFDTLLRVERQRAYASELLHALPSTSLSALDHGLATELVMGVLRWKSVLDGAIAQASSQALKKLDPEVLIALRLGLYQLHWLERIPPRAAIHESVELVKRARKRSATGLVNAVLRKMAARTVRPAQPKELTAHAIACAYAHPEWLVQRWTKTLSLQIAQAICEYDQQIPRHAIRLHDAEVEQELSNFELLPGELLRSARRFSGGDLTRTRAFRERRVVIQDEASQLVAALVGPGSRILDCCAAPGGKTEILAQANPGSTVLAVELHRHRARQLQTRLRADNVSVLVADARNLPFSAKFDRILADVPCSGTGTLARNPDIKWRLQAEDLAHLQCRQMAILRSALAQLAPGGRLIYSTCSLEPEETTAVVESVLAENSSLRVLDCRRKLARLQAEGELIVNLDSVLSGPYLRTIPGIHDCDGFFAAILQKG